MKRISQRQLPVFVSQIGLAPLVDLVLIMLLVMLVAVPLLRREKIQIPDAPKVEPSAIASKEAPKVYVTLRIAPDQTITLDDVKVPTGTLMERIKEVLRKTPDAGVLIQMPDNFAAGGLARLMAEMHRAGVKQTAVEVISATRK